MADVPFLTYPLVFMMVCVPYMAIAAVVNTPKPISDIGRNALPAVYRLFYRYIFALSQTVGATLASASPRAAKRYGDEILKSGFKLTAAMIFAATGDPEIKGRAEAMVEDLARCQREHGDGWAGSIPEKYLEWVWYVMRHSLSIYFT